MKESVVTYDEYKKYIKEFHKYWQEQGEPHPSSDKYMALTRSFFFYKGLEMGIKVAKQAHKSR